MSIDKNIYNYNYYKISGESSSDISNNYGLKIISEIAKNSKLILECGCGEGSKLFRICGNRKNCYGVDYSKIGIKIAQSKYRNINFSIGNIEYLDFPDSKFDLIYSAFVIEHTENPLKIINEMIRVTKKNGKIAIVCPNFGSMCYRSPCNKESILIRSVKILFQDLFMFLLPKNQLRWNFVKPIATNTIYKPDWDTTVEPRLTSLVHYLSGKNNVTIEKAESIWGIKKDWMPKKNKFYKIYFFITVLCKFLNRLGIYPFKFYGPQLLIILKKNSND
ncbi:MAG: Methyltransferase type 11 [Candidatus Pacebacteria bacterium GW2011_GWF2_38_9]|nr:MAG: type 11 methyltransferase [candidate division TM6 bacterium GW2011_GWF2_28_16]KKQ09324.1 MAG: Methyltransferase type 11 [Candidatus Pacebacteria bacterium GW2011_GWF1_36_5]KKQ88852.1 MAG: Methyltransferase type 11 [Candidatus Pacebacteria bacterium GW2011_GWF2_38_9]HAZ73451.1 hypothetical protein [Candidatus Paceibacterota bacterium]